LIDEREDGCGQVIYRYEQGLSPRWSFLRTFPLWQFVKFLYTGFVLNYSASAFLVSLLPAHFCQVLDYGRMASYP
jgi:hypothetical protein